MCEGINVLIWEATGKGSNKRISVEYHDILYPHIAWSVATDLSGWVARTTYPQSKICHFHTLF